MPKAKGKSEGKTPSLAADDIAAFKAALSEEESPIAPEADTDVEAPEDDQAPEGDEGEVDTDADVEAPIQGKKIKVTTEAPSHVQPKAPTPAVDGIDEVWHGHEPIAKPPDTFQKARQRGPWGWIFGGLVIVAAAALAGFFVFNRSTKFSGNNIQVVVNVPKEVTSGGDVALTIDYQNQEAVDIVQGQLTVEYPDGFTYDSSSVASSNEFHNAFPVGRVASGHAGEVVIHGHIIGSVDTTLTFTATLTFRPANFSSDFQEQGSATVKISSSILGITIDGPDKIAPNSTGTWTLTLKNTSDHDLSDVRLDVVLPDGLTITTAKPAATDGNTGWVIDSIAKGKSTSIVLTGSVGGSLGDSLQLLAKAGIVNAAGTVDPQSQQSLLIILINTGLTTTIAVNGQTDPVAITPGDTLNYTIKVANLGDAEVNDVTVTATLSGAGLDLTTLSNPLKGTVKNNVVTWTKAQVPGLALIQPNHDLSLTLSIGTTKALVVKTDSDRDPHVSLSVAITARSLSNTNSSVQPTVALSKFATVFLMTADARYYDNNQVALGTGPIPPAVGKTTAYRIIWSVTNSTSDATGMTVSTTLPVGVLWTGKNIGRDAGDIAFDPNTRKVTWSLNTVPAGTGSRLPTLTAHFEVSITPTSDQVGSVVVLSDVTTAAATDSYSGKAITGTSSSLTTDVPNDPQAAGEGKVVVS